MVGSIEKAIILTDVTVIGLIYLAAFGSTEHFDLRVDFKLQNLHMTS